MQGPLPIAFAEQLEAGRGRDAKSRLTERDYTYFLDQRAFAAFRAIAFLLLAGKACARAFPPFKTALAPDLS